MFSLHALPTIPEHKLCPGKSLSHTQPGSVAFHLRLGCQQPSRPFCGRAILAWIWLKSIKTPSCLYPFMTAESQKLLSSCQLMHSMSAVSLLQTCLFGATLDNNAAPMALPISSCIATATPQHSHSSPQNTSCLGLINLLLKWASWSPTPSAFTHPSKFNTKTILTTATALK